MSAPRIASAAPSPEAEPWLSSALRMSAYAVTAAVFAWPLSTLEGVLAGAIGAALGSIGGRRIASTSVRSWVALAAAAIALYAVVGFGELVVGSELLAAAIGPASALRAGEAAVSGLGAAVIALALRTLSARRRSLASLEVVAIAIAFARLVVAHRHGAIHRPFEIADRFLSAGADPTIALIAIGGCAGAVIGILLLSERSLARSGMHLAIAGILLLLVASVAPLAVGSGADEAAQRALGMTDDTDRAAREARERGRGGGGTSAPDFQDEYDQSQSQVPLALVLLHDDYSPPSGVYYFRQEAFSQYNGRRLIEATMSGVDDDVVSGFPTREIAIASAPASGMYRSTIETTVGLLAEHPRPFGLESPILLTPVQNPDPNRFRRTYRVRSAALTSDEWGMLARSAGDSAWSAEVRAHYTEGPGDPRYRALAERIVSALPPELSGDPLAQAVAITQWLGHEGTYSLRSRHAGAEDPTAHFLFGDRTGYCVHFSHAAVFLMRALGIPARVATGYMVPESSRRGGSAILIAGGNSHAWPEIHLEGIGWVVTDVAVERSLDPPPPPADEQLQQLLAEMLRGLRPLDPSGDDLGRPISEVVASIRGPLAIAVLALAIAALLLGYLVKGWRRIAPLISRGPARARATYRAALDALSEDGVVREWGESREAFAARVRDRVPSLVPLTARHGELVWGGRAPRDPAIAEMERSRRALRSELAKAIPWWRRALGALNPFSWLWSR